VKLCTAQERRGSLVFGGRGALCGLGLGRIGLVLALLTLGETLLELLLGLTQVSCKFGKLSAAEQHHNDDDDDCPVGGRFEKT